MKTPVFDELSPWTRDEIIQAIGSSDLIEFTPNEIGDVWGDRQWFDFNFFNYEDNQVGKQRYYKYWTYSSSDTLVIVQGVFGDQVITWIKADDVTKMLSDTRLIDYLLKDF